MTGIFREGESLAAALDRMGGGGLEIRTSVNLPMGRGWAPAAFWRPRC